MTMRTAAAASVPSTAFRMRMIDPHAVGIRMPGRGWVAWPVTKCPTRYPPAVGFRATGGGGPMPLYMDVHHMDGPVNAADVAKAHEADLAIQGNHGVDYKNYWVDEANGKIFCLVDAPNPDAANTVHRDAHGLVADEIHEVVAG